MTLGLKWERRFKVIAGALWMIFILTWVLFPTYWIRAGLFQTSQRPGGAYPPLLDDRAYAHELQGAVHPTLSPV